MSVSLSLSLSFSLSLSLSFWLFPESLSRNSGETLWFHVAVFRLVYLPTSAQPKTKKHPYIHVYVFIHVHTCVCMYSCIYICIIYPPKAQAALAEKTGGEAASFLQASVGPLSPEGTNVRVCVCVTLLLPGVYIYICAT